MFSRFSVKKPYTVAVGVIAILILGVISFMNMTTDLLPSMDLPYVVVITTYPGASPEEVEMVVTKPLESSLATVNNMNNVSSVSRENMSQVILEFNEGSNMDTAMIEINNTLDLIKPNWPDAVGAPILMKLNPDMLPVMIAAVDVEGMDPFALTDFVSEQITPRLEAVNGVASVSENGLIEQEVTVTISQELIDDVNYLILKDVDAELSKVEDQLRDGESMLRQAKTELAKQGAEGLKQIDDALSQIQMGKGQLDESLVGLKAQRAELNDQVTQLKATELLLSTTLQQAPAEMTHEQKAALSALNSQLSALRERKQAAEARLTAVEAEIKGLTQTPAQGDTGASGSDLAALERERDALKAEITSLDGQISSIERSEEYLLLMALELAVSQRPALEQQLAEVRTGLGQAEAGLSQMDATIAKLEQGIVPGGVIEGIDEETNINDAERQLITARGDAEKMMGDAEAQIADAQSELGKARKEFEEKRDDALKEAKIDGIITVQMVSQMLGAQNFEMPAGYINEGEQDFLVRVGDEYATLDEMENMLLFNLDLDSIEEVRLKDVATVLITDNSADSYSKINGNNGVMLQFQKQSTFSTAEVAEMLKETFEVLQTEYEGLHIVPLFDQGIYINIVIDSVLENLIYGAILAVLILLIFLGDYRPTVIIGFSIPISVVAAFVAMYFTGITLNVISLAGLALGVGMLVDNSIVVIENIYRLHGEGMPLIKACVKGASQMSGAIFSSTLTTICVFLPIVFIQGLARQLFADMGLTIAYSLLASLVVALTLVPAMSAGMLKRQKKRKHRIFTAIQNGYTALLQGALKVKPLVLLAAAALLVWSVMQIAALGTSFMPEVDSTQMSATLTFPEDSTFSEQTQMADTMMETLMEFDDVNTIGVFGGGGGSSLLGGSGGSSSMTFYILLNEDKTARNETIARDMGTALDPLGYDVSFSTSNMDITALYGDGIQVSVKGPEIDVLRQVTTEVADIMRSVEGTMNVSDGQEQTVPEISIVVDKEKAISEGLTVAQVYSFVSTTIADGQEVTQLTLENKDFPVIVVDGDNQALTREDMAELYITVTKGDETNDIRLGDICQITETDSLSAISRDAQQRVLTASCEIDPEYNIGIVGTELRAKLDAYVPPSGYTVVEEGENEAINSTLNDLALMIALAIVLIYLIMVAQFQSFLSPFIVIFTIPLAFTGGLLALIFSGMEVSMIAMLGFLMLAGVIVNNGIVFVDSVNQMRIEGKTKRDALIETGRVRLRPILMTTLTTVLGMSTIAMGTGMGAEMMQPMAVVTIGGLTYGTLMTLFVVPVLYDILNRKKEMKERDVDSEIDAEEPKPDAVKQLPQEG